MSNLELLDEHGIILSEDGIITRKGKTLKSVKSSNGYLAISTTFDGKRRTFTIHRLLAQKYIPNPLNLPWVNHKDGNKLNNDLSNLEWCTPSENHLHAYKTGFSKVPSGEDNWCTKLSNEEVLEIRRLFIVHGIHYAQIARIYGIAPTTIWNIAHKTRRYKQIL